MKHCWCCHGKLVENAEDHTLFCPNCTGDSPKGRKKQRLITDFTQKNPNTIRYI